MADEAYTGLATTFDTAAELYDRARPRYPSRLFDDLAELAGLRDVQARVLEIGPGTGQATRDLLARRWRVVALEPGNELARVAERVLAGLGELEIVRTPFEHYDGDDASFDVVLAATSWHWVDPAVGYEKAARLLRPGGILAIVATEHVLPDPGGDEFFRDVEAAYDAVGMGDGLGGPRPPETVEAPDVAAMTANGRYHQPGVRRYVTERSYSADEYVDLLRTYSGHIAATPQQRDTLLADIRRRIDRRPSGIVRKHYLNLLQTARRKN